MATAYSNIREVKPAVPAVTAKTVVLELDEEEARNLVGVLRAVGGINEIRYNLTDAPRSPLKALTLEVGVWNLHGQATSMYLDGATLSRY